MVIALAVGSSTLDQKKKYENVPVLRNLVPSQVLLGNSSFNTGNSISADLPSYVRTGSRRSREFWIAANIDAFHRFPDAKRPAEKRAALLFSS